MGSHLLSCFINLLQLAAPTAKGLYPMFVLSDGRESDVQCGSSDQAGKLLRVRHLDKKGRPQKGREDSEEFVFL